MLDQPYVQQVEAVEPEENYTLVEVGIFDHKRDNQRARPKAREMA